MNTNGLQNYERKTVLHKDFKKLRLFFFGYFFWGGRRSVSSRKGNAHTTVTICLTKSVGLSLRRISKRRNSPSHVYSYVKLT